MEDVIVNVKETVFGLAELRDKSKEELREILTERQVQVHHNAGPDKMMIEILASNPQPSAGTGEKIIVTEAMAKEADKGLETIDKVTKAQENDPSNVIVKIELKNPKKTGSLRVRGYTHPETGEYLELVDMHGKKRVVIIKKNEKLMLSRKNDALLYEHLKNHIYVIGPDSPIVLINTEEKAEDDITRIEEAIKVKNIISGLKGSEIRDFAMILEIAFQATTTDNVLKAFLYAKAEETPEVVMKAWKNPTKEMRILIYRGLNRIEGTTKVIRRERGAYYYDDHILGNTFEDCVIWLQQNEQVIPGLQRRTL